MHGVQGSANYSASLRAALYNNHECQALIPQFRESGVFHLTCQSITCSHGERPISPQAGTYQLFVDHHWQDRVIREYFMVLPNTTVLGSHYS